MQQPDSFNVTEPEGTAESLASCEVSRSGDEPSALNLWTRQWRSERIKAARADHRVRAAAYASLKNKTTDYAKSLRRVSEMTAQVVALWEASPVDLACPHCDDTGDVTRADGEWLGACTCPMGLRLRLADGRRIPVIPARDQASALSDSPPSEARPSNEKEGSPQ